MIVFPKAAFSVIMRRKRSFGIRSSRQSEIARPDARNGVPDNKGTSAKNVPGV